VDSQSGLHRTFCQCHRSTTCVFDCICFLVYACRLVTFQNLKLKSCQSQSFPGFKFLLSCLKQIIVFLPPFKIRISSALMRFRFTKQHPNFRFLYRFNTLSLLFMKEGIKFYSILPLKSARNSLKSIVTKPHHFVDSRHESIPIISLPSLQEISLPLLPWYQTSNLSISLSDFSAKFWIVKEDVEWKRIIALPPSHFKKNCAAANKVYSLCYFKRIFLQLEVQSFIRGSPPLTCNVRYSTIISYCLLNLVLGTIVFNQVLCYH